MADRELDPNQPQELGPADLIALGLRPPGPLAGAVTSKNPETNAQNIRATINPEPQGFLGRLQDIGLLPKVPQSKEEGLKRLKRYADISEPAMMFAAPNPAGLLGKIGVSTGLGALSGAGAGISEGDPAKAGKGALIGGAVGAGGEMAAKSLRYLFSAIPTSLFASRTGRDIASWLKANVPAWASMSTSAKGLYEMAHGTGQRELSAAFDPAMAQVAERAKGQTIHVSPEAASALGIAAAPGAAFTRGAPTSALTSERGTALIEVDAADAAKKAVGKWEKNPFAYREVVNALDAKGIGDPEARRAYQIGAGWIDLAESGNFLRGKGGKLEKYDPVKAQEAFAYFGKDALLARRMDPVRQMIEGPLSQRITPFRPAGMGYQIGKEVAGAGLGASIGGPAGAGIGALGAAMTPKINMYGNVPVQFPAIEQARRAMQSEGAGLLGALGE